MKPRLRISLNIFLCLLIALLGERVFSNKTAYRYFPQFSEISAQNLSRLESESTKTNDSDEWFSIDDFQKQQIHTLTFLFETPLKNDVTLRIRWDNGKGFIAENERTVTLLKGSQEAKITLNQYAYDLNFGFNNATEQDLSLSKIILNKNVVSSFLTHFRWDIFLLIEICTLILALLMTKIIQQSYGWMPIFVFIGSLAFSAYFTIFIAYVEMTRSINMGGSPHDFDDNNIFTILRHTVDSHFVLQLIIIFLATFMLLLVLCTNFKSLLGKIYQNRYGLAAAVILLFVLLELNGSSVAVLQDYGIGKTEQVTSVLFGKPRPIRSDDYMTWMPITASQFYNHTGILNQINTTSRGAPTDVSIEYAAPAWALVTIFRPIYWGFMLLGLSRGLSFMWIVRLLAFFFTSFEMAMIYTDQKKWLSLIAGVMVMFAPIIQWWFNTAQQIEPIIYGQAFLICLYYFLIKDNLRWKVFLTLGMFITAGAYIFTLYPAWQVPVGYVMLALFIFILLKTRGQVHWRIKRDLPLLISAIFVLLLCLAIIFTQSKDTILAIMNTAYPGSRLSTGGTGISGYFYYPGNILSVIIENQMITNQCEYAGFFSLAPLGILLAIFVMLRNKRIDALLLSLLIVQAFFFVFAYFGFPEWLSKITLLKFSPTHRIILGSGFADIILLLRSLTLYDFKPKIWQALSFSTLLAFAVTLLARKFSGNYLSPLFMSVVVFGVLWAGFILAITIRYRWGVQLFSAYSILIGILVGGLVNPLQKGLDVIYKNSLIESIEGISKDDDGLWLVENGSGDIPIFVGAPTINSTNVYPYLERWQLFDPTGQFEDIYNRYAHITAELVDSETIFSLAYADSFILNIDYKDLETLDVKYLLTPKEYSEEFYGPVQFTLLDSVNGRNIYLLQYQTAQ
jgi:hypothetical protein